MKKVRLPNGFGSIKYLKGKRTNPYVVLKPGSIENTDDKGRILYDKPLAYVDS